jgi:hypothetical protein
MVTKKTRTAAETPLRKQQESRKGKRQLPSWVDEETHHQLKVLALELRITMDRLVVEAVEALLRKHGRPVGRRRGKQ